jgi:hypothetical protein
MLTFGAISAIPDAGKRREALARKAVECDDSFGWSYGALPGVAVKMDGTKRRSPPSMRPSPANRTTPTPAYRGLNNLCRPPERGVEPVERRCASIRSSSMRFQPARLHHGHGVIMTRRAVLEQNIARHGSVGPPH